MKFVDGAFLGATLFIRFHQTEMKPVETMHLGSTQMPWAMEQPRIVSGKTGDRRDVPWFSNARPQRRGQPA